MPTKTRCYQHPTIPDEGEWYAALYDNGIENLFHPGTPMWKLAWVGPYQTEAGAIAAKYLVELGEETPNAQ